LHQRRRVTRAVPRPIRFTAALHDGHGNLRPSTAHILEQVLEAVDVGLLASFQFRQAIAKGDRDFGQQPDPFGTRRIVSSPDGRCFDVFVCRHK
jgi:hypothetical protein